MLLTKFLTAQEERLKARKWRIKWRPESSWRGLEGLCEPATKTIHVCTGHSQWLAVLCHELGHWEQEMDPELAGRWPDEAFDVAESWIRGKKKNMDAGLALEAIRIVQDCELDAERRAIALMGRFRLFSAKGRGEYSASANSGIWAYELGWRLRRWPRIPAEDQAKLPRRLMAPHRIGSPPPLLVASVLRRYSKEAGGQTK